jgi:hypothetical protein
VNSSARNKTRDEAADWLRGLLVELQENGRDDMVEALRIVLTRVPDECPRCHADGNWARCCECGAVV